MSSDTDTGDLFLTCVDGSQTFAFTDGERRFFVERELTHPRRCPSCRAERRQARDQGGSGAENGARAERVPVLN